MAAGANPAEDASVATFSFSIKDDGHGRVFTLSVAGDLDLPANEALGRAVRRLATHEGERILDLRRAGLIDSSALGRLVQLKRDYPDVRLIGSPQVQHTFEVAGLSRLLT
jgi:anti-anti-sigma factor